VALEKLVHGALELHSALTGGRPPLWGLGEGLSTPRRKEKACYEMLHRVSEFVNCCEHGNEPSGSRKGGEFLDYLGDS